MTCTVLHLPFLSVNHYNDVMMGVMASQITSLTIVYSTVYSGTDQRKHQSSASLAFLWGIHRWPVNYLHKCPTTRKMFPFDDVIMFWRSLWVHIDIQCSIHQDVTALVDLDIFTQYPQLACCKFGICVYSEMSRTIVVNSFVTRDIIYRLLIFLWFIT